MGTRWTAAATGCVAAAALYAPVVAGLARQWYADPDAAYGSFVAVAAAVAAWQRWTLVRSLPIRPSWIGAIALGVAGCVYIAGTLAADLFLVRVSMVAFAGSALLFVCGVAHARALAAPLALLLLAIPLPAIVVTELTMPLQLIASQCAVAILDVAGVPVLREGNVLTLSHVSLEVAEACSGMRSIVTLLALTAVYASLCGATARLTAVLALATVPVALAGNGVRIAFTGLLATQIGESAARGVIHDATGWAAFVLMGAALVALGAVASTGNVLRRAVA